MRMVGELAKSESPLGSLVKMLKPNMKIVGLRYVLIIHVDQ